MRIYSKTNVYDAALERINWIYDEFDNVMVSFSGGKDSTVCLRLALQVAQERNRLPLDVLFIDQEAEWNGTVKYMREVQAMPGVRLHWLQVPIKISNATSFNDRWLYCWEEGKKWMREKEPDSIHENIYGTDVFYDMFDNFIRVNFKGERVCAIGGVRCEESPSRTAGLTNAPTYKWATWGKRTHGDSVILYPIYDWSWTDIWKAIHEHGWSYCEIYDKMYQYGVTVRNMRVSNLHHEMAINTMRWLQEIEPATWVKLTKRLDGINTAGTLIATSAFNPTELPFMFDTWLEYRDYLLEKLITDDNINQIFRDKFSRMDEYYEGFPEIDEVLHRCQVAAILTNDYHMVKVTHLLNRPGTTIFNFARVKRGHADWTDHSKDKGAGGQRSKRRGRNSITRNSKRVIAPKKSAH